MPYLVVAHTAASQVPKPCLSGSLHGLLKRCTDEHSNRAAHSETVFDNGNDCAILKPV